MRPMILCLCFATSATPVFLVGCSQKQQQGVFSRPQSPPPPTDVKLAADPNILPSTRYAAARLFESNGQFDKAITQYRKAIADDDKFVDAYDRLGLLYSLQGRHEEAEKALRTAIQISPSEVALRNNLAFGLILQRRWADAERELRRAIMLDPSFTRAHINLGLVMTAQGRFDDALAQYRAVLPEADAHYNLGLAYRAQHRSAEAKSAFRRVLALDPDFTAAKRQIEFLDNRASEQPNGVGSSLPRGRHAALASAAVVPETTGVTATVLPFDDIAAQDTEAQATLENRTDSAADSGSPPTIQFGKAPSTGAARYEVVPGDMDADGDVDEADFERFRACLTRPNADSLRGCEPADLDHDQDIDALDFARLQILRSTPR